MFYNSSHMDKPKLPSCSKDLASAASFFHAHPQEWTSAGDSRAVANQWQTEVDRDKRELSNQSTPNAVQKEKPVEVEREVEPAASQWQPGVSGDYSKLSCQNPQNVQQAERPMALEKAGANMFCNHSHMDKPELPSCSKGLASAASFFHAHPQEWTSAGDSRAVANQWQTEIDRDKRELSNQSTPNAVQKEKPVEVEREVEPAASQWQPGVSGDYSKLSCQNPQNVQQAERPMALEKAGKGLARAASFSYAHPQEWTSAGDSRASGSHWQQDVYGGFHIRHSYLNTPNAENAERHMELLEKVGQSTTLDHGKQLATNKPCLRGRRQRSNTEELSRVVTQKVLQQKDKECEECEKMKEKIKDLEARVHMLLSKAMSMHQNSENMNDCWRLSAVLQRYDKLRLHEWEKLRTAQAPLSYSAGSEMIKEMFNACEVDLQHRMNKAFEVFEIPASNDTAVNSKQGLMQQIRDILKYVYSQKNLKFYSDVLPGYEQRNDTQRRFIMECCQVYCLLCLQDMPIKAEWCLEKRSEKYIEHVDKKGLEHCGKRITLLWPILKSGEQVIRKGIIYDEK